MFEKNVIAHGIDECAQTVRLSQTFFAAEGGKDPNKDFLPEVIDGIDGLKAAAQLEIDELAEVGHEMLLRAEIAGTKPLQISVIERKKFHCGCLGNPVKCAVFYTSSPAHSA